MAERVHGGAGAGPGALRPLPFKLALLGGFVSGALYFTAFAGMDIWPFAFVCFVPLYISLLGQTPRRALFIGLAAGATMNAFGFYWLLEMLRVFSGFPVPLCLLFVLLVATYQGGRLALMGWLFARGAIRGWSRGPVFVAAFIASELFFPVLFPWYYAAAVHQLPALTQVADLGGPILVGVVLLLVNMALAEPLLARLEKRPWDRRVLATGGGALVATLLYGLVRIAMVDAQVARAEPLHVGIVQGNMGLMQKREDPGEGLRRHKRLTQELRQKGAELVVWSESSVTFAVPEAMTNPFMKDRVAGSAGVPLIFGAVVFRVDPDRERWYNTALSTNRQGEVTARYDKHFLLAFGEYLPFGEELPILHRWSPNSGRFSKGTTFAPLLFEKDGKTHKIGTLICYEDILPGFTREAVAASDPELLVNITNDAWFGDTLEPWQHLALSKFRAIEHRRYLVRSTNSGVSAIVDPVGRTLLTTKTFAPASADAVIHWMRATTLYQITGDIPWLLVTAAAFFMAFRARKPRPLAA